MDLSQRITTVAGFAMILVAILTVVTVGLTAAGQSDKGPFEDDEIVEYLTDVEDKGDLLTAAGIVGIANDGIVIPIIAAAIYVLFRDRNPHLATLTLIAFAMAAAISLIVDISNIMLVAIAKDYVSGGPGGIEANDPSALMLGKYVGMITYAFTNLLFTPLGIGLIAIGAIINWAPQGIVNPPKWIGWVALIAGVACELSWTVVAVDAGLIFFPINLIATLILLVGLGIWLIQHGDLQPAPMRA